jgi:hypothetical protein
VCRSIILGARYVLGSGGHSTFASQTKASISIDWSRENSARACLFFLFSYSNVKLLSCTRFLEEEIKESADISAGTLIVGLEFFCMKRVHSFSNLTLVQ